MPWAASAFVISALLSPFAEEVPVYPSVAAHLIDFLAEFEGRVTWMYVDKLGRIATGIGTDINTPPAACAIRWLRADGTTATGSEVQAEWLRVHALQAHRNEGGGSPTFRDSARLHVDPESLAAYTTKLLANYEDVLRSPHHLGDAYDACGADCQVARLRTAYADGPGSPWPKLDAAIRARDFLAAANESKPHDYDTQNASYRASYDAVRVLYENAAVVEARGWDRSVLYWPRHLADEQPDTLPELDADDAPVPPLLCIPGANEPTEPSDDAA